MNTEKTIFTRIIEGEIPCYKVAEDEKFFAFLDARPIKEGHTLVVPKEQIDNFFDLPDQTIGEMQVFAKKIANRIQEVYRSRKVAMIVIGLEVPHAHIHLIPIDHERDVDFTREKLILSSDQFKEIQHSLQL